MPKKSPITYKYNPALSVKENAEKCGVTVAAIRKYIKENNIDRRREAAIHKQKTILTLKEKNPDISIAEIARQTGYSENTVRKYINQTENHLKIDTKKVSKFDVSNKSVIKSISDNQDEILYNILKLYIPKGEFDCDFTYSIGNFYKHIPQPRLKFDKYPQVEGVRPLEDVDKIPSCSLNSVVVDLPFIIKQNKFINDKSLIINRFDCFEDDKELYTTNDYMLELSYRVLVKNGLLILKTMDVNSPYGQIWVSNYVCNKAVELGFDLVDKFILTSPHRHVFYKGEQRHARKYHSYFLVFKKKSDNKLIKTNKTVLFDFDDTLFDTTPTKSLRSVKTKDWESIYEQIPNCRLYEGFHEVFDFINKNKIKVGIVSIAQKELINRTVKHFDCPCDQIQGWWRLPMKPYPHQVNKAIEKLKANAQDVIMFGDSPDDVAACRAAGIKIVGCSWGLQNKEEINVLINSNPDYIIHNPIEIINILQHI